MEAEVHFLKWTSILYIFRMISPNYNKSIAELAVWSHSGVDKSPKTESAIRHSKSVKWIYASSSKKIEDNLQVQPSKLLDDRKNCRQSIEIGKYWIFSDLYKTETYISQFINLLKIYVAQQFQNLMKTFKSAEMSRLITSNFIVFPYRNICWFALGI